MADPRRAEPILQRLMDVVKDAAEEERERLTDELFALHARVEAHAASVRSVPASRAASERLRAAVDSAISQLTAPGNGRAPHQEQGESVDDAQAGRVMKARESAGIPAGEVTGAGAS